MSEDPPGGVFHVEHPVGVWVRFARARRLHVPLLLVLCALVFFPRIGERGLTSTEGHRVIPAWEILETDEWLPTRMFERAYVRKPPGMPWAVAAASMALGPSELAARAVSAASATLMVVVAYGFATRWFGAPWGFLAGVAQLTLPRMLGPSRSAEIESLHQLGVQLTALTLIHALVVVPPGARGKRALWGACAGLSAILMVLAKGPAGAPVALGALGAACLTLRSWSPLRSGATWLTVALAAGGAGALILAIRASIGDEPAIVQTPAEFVWEWERLGGALTFAPLVLLGAAPWSLALLFPFGAKALREGDAHVAEKDGRKIARACAWTTLLALGCYVLFLISNPRYGVPALVAIPPVVAWLFRAASDGRLSPSRSALARVLSLGWPPAWPVALVAYAIAFPHFMEPRILDESGLLAGEALATHLPDGAEIWAHGMVEARPEVLAYAKRAAAREGRSIRLRWLREQLLDAAIPPAGAFVLIKHDSTERNRYVASGRLQALEPVAEGSVHQYEFTLYRSRGADRPIP